jgi:hypothetical protein
MAVAVWTWRELLDVRFEHASWRIVDRGFLNDTRNLGLRFSRTPIGRSHLVVLATQIERHTSGLMTTTEKPTIILASIHFIATYLDPGCANNTCTIASGQGRVSNR